MQASQATTWKRSSSPFPDLRVRRIWWLAMKDVRELVASRASLLVALAIAPLVGDAFITAVRAYAEASGVGDAPAALAQGLSPLDGIVVPTFGAYALVATLLFPFVAIRLLSAEKESGGLTLLLQGSVSLPTQIALKFLVLVGAWVIAWIPGVCALLLWRSYGGHLYAAEVATVLFGHLLRGALVGALALTAAAITDGAASAAVVALGITLGTWALDFVAQVHGGLAQRIAGFTPEAMLRVFERGEVSLRIVGVSVVVIAMLLGLAIIWIDPSRRRATRLALSVALVFLGTALGAATALLHSSWDSSEDQRNSFSPADEAALRRLPAPLRVTANLAPEDPRLADLDRGVFRKLERTLADVHIESTVKTGTGLFVRSGQGYGEVWYQVGDKRAMTRSTTEPIVLETIYALGGVSPPLPDTSHVYPGFPLAAAPRGARVIFFVLFPAIVACLWWWRRPRRRATALAS